MSFEECFEFFKHLKYEKSNYKEYTGIKGIFALYLDYDEIYGVIPMCICKSTNVREYYQQKYRKIRKLLQMPIKEYNKELELSLKDYTEEKFIRLIIEYKIPLECLHFTYLTDYVKDGFEEFDYYVQHFQTAKYGLNVPKEYHDYLRKYEVKGVRYSEERKNYSRKQYIDQYFIPLINYIEHFDMSMNLYGFNRLNYHLILKLCEKEIKAWRTDIRKNQEDYLNEYDQKTKEFKEWLDENEMQIKTERRGLIKNILGINKEYEEVLKHSNL